MAADPTDDSGSAERAGHLAPGAEDLGVAGPGAGGEVGDDPGGDAPVAIEEAVGDGGPVAARAEVVEDLVVDARGHAGDVAGLLLLADGGRGLRAPQLLEDEPVVGGRAVEGDLHP